MPSIGQGTPRAELDDTFVAQAEALIEEAAILALSLVGRAQRVWQLGYLGDWNGNPLDIASITGAYNRDDLNQAYAAALNPDRPGTTADCIALKLQVDWLAAEERAFRTRHATNIRSSIHAAARRQGHASVNGVFGAGVVGYVQEVIRRGS